MNKDIPDEQLIALLEGEGNPELEVKISSDISLQKRYDQLKEVFEAINKSSEVEVPSHISFEFHKRLQEEKNKNGRGPWMRIAAAATLLIIGFGAGKFSNDRLSGTELLDLRTEIQALREVTLTSALQKHSASERIMAVNQIEEKSSV
ncbi:MAG: hypothetical protein AAFY41_04415, partial [Bacteroidota bacterium]